MDMKKLSPTAMATYMACPKKFDYTYNRQVIPLESRWQESLDFGRLIHEIVANYYREVTDELTPNLIKLNIYAEAKKIIDFNGLTKEDREKVDRHLKVFCEFEVERIRSGVLSKPLAVEKDIERAGVHAIVDALFKHKDGRLILYDWKTLYGWYPQLNDGMMIQGAIQKFVTGADEMNFVFLQSGTVLPLPEDVNMLLVKPIYYGIKNKHFDRQKGEQCLSCPFNIICRLEEMQVATEHI